MKKLSIVVADDDEFYLKQLTGYMIRSEARLEVFSFDNKQSLSDFLNKSGADADILIVSESMCCQETDNCSLVKFLLTEYNYQQRSNYNAVKKYQKAADLVSQIMLVYGKKSGEADKMAQGDKRTRCIGIYSPIGGSGKTTLALMLACRLAASDKKVFYLNCERIDSTKGILPPLAKIGLSELLVAALSGEKGIGLSMLTGMYTSHKLGFSYINAADSSLEWNEIDINKQLALLDEVRKISRFDALIMDFDSELNGDKIEFLQLCDNIVMPFLPDVISLNKLMQFLQELSLRPELDGLYEKIIFAGNRISPGTEAYLERSGLLGKCRPVSMLLTSKEMANVGSFIKNGEIDSSAVADIASEIFK